MCIPTVKSCCCGCSLKTGTVTIGALHLVGAVIVLILGIIVIAAGSGLEDLINQLIGGGIDVDSVDGLDSITTAIYIIGGVVIAVGIIAIILNSCLIHGARKVRAKQVDSR